MGVIFLWQGQWAFRQGSPIASGWRWRPVTV